MQSAERLIKFMYSKSYFLLLWILEAVGRSLLQQAVAAGAQRWNRPFIGRERVARKQETLFNVNIEPENRNCR